MLLRKNTKKESTNKTEPKSARLMSNFLQSSRIEMVLFSETGERKLQVLKFSRKD